MRWWEVLAFLILSINATTFYLVQAPSYQTELSQEQLDRILLSDDFKVFVDRTSRLVERALCDSSDILFDYLTGANGEAG